MNESPTYKQIANSFELWGTHIDTQGLDSLDAFNAKTEAEKLAFIAECFGLEEDQYPNN